jgi:hypothetical protein
MIDQTKQPLELSNLPKSIENALRTARESLGQVAACSFKVGTDEHFFLVSRLFELSAQLPVKEVPILIFNSDLETDRWFAPYHKPSTRAVVEHCRRILDCNLDYPIILNAEGRILDGVHRLGKAVLEERQTIKAVQFIFNPEPDAVAKGVWA